MAGQGDTYVPEPGPDGLRHWMVAGGVVLDSDQRVLLVNNKRRNGDTDWSPPGGVVDPGESPTEALGREVEEETGLAVSAWGEALYRVEVTAPGFGFFLQVVAHRAVSYQGGIVIDDPDGIVIAAEFMDHANAIDRMAGAPQWVAEPMSAHLLDGVDDGRLFAYRLDGTSAADRTVTRLDP